MKSKSNKRVLSGAVIDNLMQDIEAMILELRAFEYSKHRRKVRHLVRAARIALIRQNGRLGSWETVDLAQAEMAVTANFLLLAMVATKKAIMANRQPPSGPLPEWKYAKLAH